MHCVHHTSLHHDETRHQLHLGWRMDSFWEVCVLFRQYEVAWPRSHDNYETMIQRDMIEVNYFPTLMSQK